MCQNATQVCWIGVTNSEALYQQYVPIDAVCFPRKIQPEDFGSLWSEIPLAMDSSSRNVSAARMPVPNMEEDCNATGERSNFSLPMARIISAPSRIQAEGEPPKIIEEFFGRLNSGTSVLSIARMVSPSGWSEPGQTPSFDEFTVVFRGQLQVETRGAVHQVSAGQAVWASSGEWIRYSTPGPEGAEYVSVCMPAFSAETVHRDTQ